MDRAELERRVAAARVACLATLDPDGRANLVPVCFAYAEGRLYSAVDRKPKRTSALRRLQNVRERPSVTLLLHRYDEDWEALWWIRLRGLGRVVEDAAERDHALALLLAKYAQYRAAPPEGPVLAVEVEEWRAWEAGKPAP